MAGVEARLRMSEEKSIIWVDWLRVIATFGVVLLHSAAPLLYKFNDLPRDHWWFANFYDSIVRMCVPLFFMISGHLLLGKQERLPAFFQKRVNKVVLPLLAWSIIYLAWRRFVEHSADFSAYYLFSIALTPAYYHLWFLYAIAGIYLLVPILRVVAGSSDRTLLAYYVLVWLFAVSVIPIGEELTGIKSRIDLLSISGYSGYLVLGYCLGKLTMTKSRAQVSAVIFFAAFTVTALGTYWLTVNSDGKLRDYFYSYLSPNVIFMSAAFFALARLVLSENVALSRPSVNRLLKSLSSASFGIYLVHAMYLYVLVDALPVHPAFGVPATALLAFVLSYLTIIVIKRIPVLRHISP